MLELEQKQSLALILEKKFQLNILPVLCQCLCLESKCKLHFPSEILTKILHEMINLGESEPYGVLGGTLILHFGSRHTKVDKIDRFPLSDHLTSTFELHLVLQPANSSKMRLVLEKLVDKLKGRPSTKVINQSFSLVKKKLYR